MVCQVLEGKNWVILLSMVLFDILFVFWVPFWRSGVLIATRYPAGKREIGSKD